VLTAALVALGNLAVGLERVVTTDANGNFAFVSFALSWRARSDSERASRGRKSADKGIDL